MLLTKKLHKIQTTQFGCLQPHWPSGGTRYSHLIGSLYVYEVNSLVPCLPNLGSHGHTYIVYLYSAGSQYPCVLSLLSMLEGEPGQGTPKSPPPPRASHFHKSEPCMWVYERTNQKAKPFSVNTFETCMTICLLFHLQWLTHTEVIPLPHSNPGKVNSKIEFQHLSSQLSGL